MFIYWYTAYSRWNSCWMKYRDAHSCLNSTFWWIFFSLAFFFFNWRKTLLKYSVLNVCWLKYLCLHDLKLYNIFKFSFLFNLHFIFNEGWLKNFRNIPNILPMLLFFLFCCITWYLCDCGVWYNSVIPRVILVLFIRNLLKIYRSVFFFSFYLTQSIHVQVFLS